MLLGDTCMVLRDTYMVLGDTACRVRYRMPRARR